MSSSKRLEETIELYDKMVAAVTEIDRKGKTTPYTSLNGHMFSFVSKEGFVAIRLPKEEREKFLIDYNTELAISHGAVMKEYVRIPDSMIDKTESLASYLEISFRYIQTLKPKPTKRKP